MLAYLNNSLCCGVIVETTLQLPQGCAMTSEQANSEPRYTSQVIQTLAHVLYLVWAMETSSCFVPSS